MKIIAICAPGTEDICTTEIRELCAVDSVQHESAVIFETTEKKIIDFCYFSQSTNKILGFLGYLDFKNLDDIIQFTKTINLTGWTNSNTTFKVKCTRLGEHNFRSETIAHEVGEVFYEKDQLKVDLNNPDIIIYVYIFDNNCYIGIDLTHMDHSKRDYKMFSPSETIKGPIAYTLLRLANYDERFVLVNPFSGSGTIEIEAALFALKKSINHYKKDRFHFDRLLPFKEIYFDEYFDELDKNIQNHKLKIYGFDNFLAHVKYAQKNAKIAGVDKAIYSSKMDVEWLDTKFEKETIDKMVSFVPSPSKRKSEQDIQKIYKELFYQLEFILKPEGMFVAITHKNELLKQTAKENKFKIIHERQVRQGKTKFWINVLEKQEPL